ncbi:hypothetical protein LTR17_018607 [Elasticomyces elasticus]|nr:hypothetical protein LTR17_018607 [Elasticomyces elasticus]
MPSHFSAAKDVPDLAGKVILYFAHANASFVSSLTLITGGNAGIGAATVRGLALHHPACIYLCARKVSAAETLIKDIHNTSPKANIRPLQLDLASFDSVRRCADEFNRASDRLDILFLNAGISATAPALTTDGYESQFGVNHMGHALLTQLLLPKMLATKRQHLEADLRIHATASLVGVKSFVPKKGIDVSDIHNPDAFDSGLVRYGHSKLANILFARKIAQLYPAVHSTSSHPGVVKSELIGKPKAQNPWLSRLLAPIIWWMGVTTEEGAKTQLWCTTASTKEVKNGKFYLPIGVLTDDNKHVLNPALADELWEWTTSELSKHGGLGWPASGSH